MEIVTGTITRMDGSGIYIHIPNVNVDRAVMREYKEVQVGLPDGRTITPEQRRKSYALINEIAEWVGDLPEYVKRLMKLEFVTNRLQSLEKELFSLSNCDVTTAKEFITYLVDFIIAHDVPTRVPLSELCDDIGKYVYACLMHKKCACCGQKAELHHYDTIGSQGNHRDEIYQIGMRVISLCREHHSKAHTLGRAWLTNTMHLQPIPLTIEIGKVYKLTKKNLYGKE